MEHTLGDSAPARNPSGMPRPVKVVIAVSHPIQHFCPLYSYLAANPALNVTVLFGVRTGTGSYFDADFGSTIDTGVSAELTRFNHRFIVDSDDLSVERTITRAAVWQHLEALDPDVVVVYGTHQATPKWTWLWSRWKRRPVAYISDSEDRGASARRALSTVAAGVVLNLTTRILSVGDANRDYYRRRRVRASRIADLAFSIDRNLYDAALADAAALRSHTRSNLGIDDELVVMTCGKLLKTKRPADIIHAASLMSGNSCTVLLVGSGEESDYLAEIADRMGVRVLLPGFVVPEQLPAYYLASDLYVHPSEVDAHPLAVSEAIYCGLPIMVSDHIGSWGPNDDVQPGRNGDVYPLGDVTRLRDLITQLRDDHERRRSYSTESRIIARTRQVQAFEGFASELLKMAS